MRRRRWRWRRHLVNPQPVRGGNYTPGVFPPRADFAGQCISPRPAPAIARRRSPRRCSCARGPTICTSGTAKCRTRIRTASRTSIDYFDDAEDAADHASGNAKDRFHFTFDTDDWIALSQGGQSIGYGAEIMLIGDGRRRARVVAFVEPGTPAGNANVTRGMEVLLVNGVDFVNDNTQAGVDTLNAAFFPTSTGQTFTSVSSRVGDGTDASDVSLTPRDITHEPVPLDQDDPKGADTVGYLLFNDHIATAEQQLFDAINRCCSGVNDLILDLRYNGGGFLDIASELAFMIARPRTGGTIFERLVFNNKNPNRNPITGEPLHADAVPHHGAGLRPCRAGTPLPTLDLNRVYVITGPNTCSASESIINGLRGVGVQVFQIGSTTCGKPYGFYPQDNCGTTYFSIQFQGVNAMGFGDYPDGFAPQNQSGRSARTRRLLRSPTTSRTRARRRYEGRLKAGALRQPRASGNFRSQLNASVLSVAPATGFAPGAQLKPGLRRLVVRRTSSVRTRCFKSPLPRELRIILDRSKSPVLERVGAIRLRMAPLRVSPFDLLWQSVAECSTWPAGSGASS